MHDWHVHGIDHDHDHGPIESIEDNPLWIMDHIELKSVGIDIGSAGTQVSFSLLKLRRMGEDLTSRYIVTERTPLYHSPVALTPYLDEERIDEKGVWEIIARAYGDSGLDQKEIDTGVVLLTGEAIRRRNARAIGEVLASQGGEFVCAAAGHNMEALLAAYGSGAALVSYERQKLILNIDIGGGTTKLALVENGKVIETAALHIGGRLLVIDENRRIVRFEPGGRKLASLAGLAWELGDIASFEGMERMAGWMARAIVDAVTVRPLSPELMALFLTPAPEKLDRIGGVLFSGGVGEYVYDREERDFNDLGKLLGGALRREILRGGLPWPLLPAGECIRATVIGAASYSLQVSGNTISLSGDHLLPRKNLQVLHPDCKIDGVVEPANLAARILDHFKRFDLIEGACDVALSFHWRMDPVFDSVAAFVEGIKLGMAETIRRGRPLYIILDRDLAQTVGALFREDPAITGEILVIDGITLQDFDFIDLGRMLKPSMTVPVTVKSLIFRQDQHGGVTYE